MQSGKKYVPPGRLGSDKHKKYMSKKKAGGHAEKAEAQAGNGGDGDEAHIVEKLLATRVTGQAREFQVQWYGYPDPADWTWEPAENLVRPTDRPQRAGREQASQPTRKLS